MLIRFLGSGEVLIKDVKLNVIEDYMMSLKEKKTMKATSMNSQIRGIRAFVYYFMERGYINNYKIKLMKADQEIKEAYSEDELRILLEKPDIKQCSFSEYRDWVMINFLCATGCRKRTLVNVRIEDLDFDNNLIKLRVTKSRKEQIIPMSMVLDNILKEYLKYRQHEREYVNIYGM